MEQIENNREEEVRIKRLETLSTLKSGREFSDEVLEQYPELLKDKEVVTTLCNIFPGYIESASNELKKDEDFIVTIAKSIDFKKFPNYGVGGKGITVFIRDAGYYGVDENRIAQRIKS